MLFKQVLLFFCGFYADAAYLPANFSKIPFMQHLSGSEWETGEQQVISQLSKKCHYLYSQMARQKDEGPQRRDTFNFICSGPSDVQAFYNFEVGFENEKLIRAVATIPWNAHGAAVFFAQEPDPNYEESDSLIRTQDRAQRMGSYKKEVAKKVLPKLKKYDLASLRAKLLKVFPANASKSDVNFKTWDDMMADKGTAIYFSQVAGVEKDPLIQFFNGLGVVEIIASK